MMTKAEISLMVDLELLYDKWSREYVTHVKNNIQPTREYERRHVLELKKIITDHFGVDITTMEGYIK